MGKGNERFGAWSFSAVWRFPEDTVGQQSQDLSLMDSALGCFVLELESCPQYLRYFEFKYSLSDWEVARTDRPIRVPVSGYLQIDRNRAIDSDNLKNWFIADWRPVHHGLRRNETFLAWAQTDAAFRHVQVCGKPSVACGGRPKKDKPAQDGNVCPPSAVVGGAAGALEGGSGGPQAAAAFPALRRGDIGAADFALGGGAGAADASRSALGPSCPRGRMQYSANPAEAAAASALHLAQWRSMSTAASASAAAVLPAAPS